MYLIKFDNISTRKNTPWKVSKYQVISGPYFPVFGLNTYLDTLRSEGVVYLQT